MEKKKSNWIDVISACGIILAVIAFIAIAVVFYQQNQKDLKVVADKAIALQQQKEKEKVSFEENQYKALSDYLKIDEKNILLSGENEEGYLVKTNKKSYTVIFNDDGNEIEKIIEN